MPQVPLWNRRSGCSLSWVRERQAPLFPQP